MKSKLLMLLSLSLSLLSINSFAAVGIKLSAGSWNVNSSAGSGAGTWLSSTLNLQNIGNENANVFVKATNTQNWILSAAPGLDSFSMEYGDGSNWKSINLTNGAMVNNMGAAGSMNFMLRYRSPSDVTDKYNTAAQISTITISVVSALLNPATSYIFYSKYGVLGAGNGQFNYPFDVAFDSLGNIYVTETNTNSEVSWNCRVQKFDSNFNFITKWGTRGSGDGEFNYPRGIVIDSHDNVYVADIFNHRIQKFTSNGTFIKKWGTLGSADGQLNQPFGIAIDGNDNIYVAEYYGHRISKFSPDGVFLAKYGTEGTGNGQLFHPQSVAVDSAGNMYVADNGNCRVQKLGPDGSYIAKWGSYGTGDGQFDSVMDVEIDRWGNVLATDTRNALGQNRIQVFSSNGVFLSKFGGPGYGTADGQFNVLSSIKFNASGYCYAVDMFGNRIEIFKPQN